MSSDTLKEGYGMSKPGMSLQRNIMILLGFVGGVLALKLGSFSSVGKAVAKAATPRRIERYCMMAKISWQIEGPRFS